MRAKFSDGKTGQFTTFNHKTNKQRLIQTIRTKSIIRIITREVTFDFVNYLYDIIARNKSLPVLQWYEYINPPQNNT